MLHPNLRWCIVFLFLFAKDFTLQIAMDQEGFGIRWQPPTSLTDLVFADDIALLADTKKNMKTMTRSMEQEAAKVGLRISRTKDK